MIRLFIHLGYPKTGTTTLQQSVFDTLFRDGRLSYLGMFGFQRDDKPNRKDFFRKLTDAMYLENEVAFETVLPDLRARFKRLVESFDVGAPLLISNEHFTLSQSSVSRKGERIEVGRTARRLARVFADVNVDLLMGIRRQDDLAWSLFLENRARAGHAHKDEYQDVDAFMQRLADRQLSGYHLYDFESVLATYSAAFPKARKLVWTYERFRDDPQSVVADILKFVGLESPCVSASEFDLKPRNVKASSGKPVALIKVPPIIRNAAQLGRSAGLHLDKFSPFRQAIYGLLPKDKPEPPNLTKRQAIMAAFYLANANLAARYPELAANLRDYGYLEERMSSERDNVG